MAKSAPASTTPTVGRIVHYGGKRGNDALTPCAALVIDVDDAGLPTLQITYHDGHRDIQKHVLQSEELTPGSWMWPPRES